MRAVALIAVLAATNAAAQDRMTQADCAGSLGAVMEAALFAMPQAEVTVDGDGWCAMDGASFQLDNVQRATIDSLRWRGTDLARVAGEGLPPRTLDIDGAGLSIRPVTGDPVFDYLLGLQVGETVSRFSLSARWDGVQNALVLDDATVVLDPDNSLSLSARVVGVDLTDRGTIQTSLGRAGLTAATADVQFGGLFESYVALPLGAALLEEDGPPPAAQVETLKAQAMAFVDNLPDRFLPAPSRAALGDFLRAMPQPRGRAQVQITAEPAFGAARAMVLMAERGSLAEIVDRVEGVSATFVWTPQEERQ